MREREAGFTALELVVTLVIIAVVTIAVIPTLANVWADLAVNRTKGAAEQVASAIEQTRAYAILQSCIYRVRFPGNAQFQIIPDPGTCATDALGEGPTQIVNNGLVAPQGGADGGCGGGGWCVWFNSTGNSSGGTIGVNPGNEPRTVRVTVAGRVRVTVP
jgi:type II secretory pathway pseudopilin PulG